MRHLHGRLIAFDLDGTLVDSRRDLAESANQLIAECGGRPLPELVVGDMVGEGAAVLVRRALRAADVAEPPGAVARFVTIYDSRLLEHTTAYAGVVQALHAARLMARLAVLTNKPLGLTERLLEGLDLRRHFDDVVGGDGPHPRKPDPAALRVLMTRAGATPAQTLLVGDSAIDCETARRAPTRMCLARYGFGSRTIGPEQAASATWIVDEAAALPDVFRAFASADLP